MPTNPAGCGNWKIGRCIHAGVHIFEVDIFGIHLLSLYLSTSAANCPEPRSRTRIAHMHVPLCVTSRAKQNKKERKKATKKTTSNPRDCVSVRRKRASIRCVQPFRFQLVSLFGSLFVLFFFAGFGFFIFVSFFFRCSYCCCLPRIRVLFPSNFVTKIFISSFHHTFHLERASLPLCVRVCVFFPTFFNVCVCVFFCSPILLATP